MKLVLAGMVLVLVVGAQAQWYKFSRKAVRFTKEIIQGSRDTWRAYSDMKEANWKNSDKHFHARGNYDGARRGPGGRWPAEVIRQDYICCVSMTIVLAGGFLNAYHPRLPFDVLQSFLGSGGRGHKDPEAAQRANGWAYNGRDPKHYRPKAHPTKY